MSTKEQIIELFKGLNGKDKSLLLNELVDLKSSKEIIQVDRIVKASILLKMVSIKETSDICVKSVIAILFTQRALPYKESRKGVNLKSISLLCLTRDLYH